jgi:hypothetical protein
MIWGIDFGTSTTLLSHSFRSSVRSFPLGSAANWIPSVAVENEGRIVAGEEALQFGDLRLIRAVKRKITEKNVATVDYFDGLETRTIDVDQVVVAILKKVKALAERTLGGDEVEARFGCPAIWDGNQRARLLRLIEEAGFHAQYRQLIDEPIAACISWVQAQLLDGKSIDGNVMVYDMGGGTLDVAIVRVKAEPGRKPSFFVKSSSGAAIAGEHVDEQIAFHLEYRLREQGRITGPKSNSPDKWLLAPARELKERLSSSPIAKTAIVHPLHGQLDLFLTKEHLDEITGPLLKAAWTAVTRALYLAEFTAGSKGRGVSPHDASQSTELERLQRLDHVVLAGGMAPMLAIREDFVTRGVDASVIEIAGGSNGNPNEAISLGLAEDLEPDQLNLARPSFHLNIRWESKYTDETGVVRVYDAYSPLYDENNTSATPCFRWTGDSDLPKSGTIGFLKVEDPRTGEELQFRIKDTRDTTKEIYFENSRLRQIVLYPNGWLLVQSDQLTKFRVANWPFGDYSKYVDIELEDGHTPEDPLPWADVG